MWQKYTYRGRQGSLLCFSTFCIIYAKSRKTEQGRFRGREEGRNRSIGRADKTGWKETVREKLCKYGVSWNHSVERRILSAWLCALFCVETLNGEGTRETGGGRVEEEGVRGSERKKERGQKCLRRNNQIHMMLDSVCSLQHTLTRTHTHARSPTSTTLPPQTTP